MTTLCQTPTILGPGDRAVKETVKAFIAKELTVWSRGGETDVHKLVISAEEEKKKGRGERCQELVWFEMG